MCGSRRSNKRRGGGEVGRQLNWPVYRRLRRRQDGGRCQVGGSRLIRRIAWLALAILLIVVVVLLVLFSIRRFHALKV